MKLNIPNAVLAISTAAIFITACGGSGGGKGGDSVKKPHDSIGVTPVKFKDQSFMVPSPMQIAVMIKKSQAPYDKSMLNPSGNYPKYSDGMKQALNLGIYGADLGYITMYDNNVDAMEYYKTVVKLADELKITGSFDKALMQRFSDNVGKKDSILSLVGEAYRRSDNFLKDNQQGDMAALVLAGGWVEGIYFSLNVYKLKNDDAIAKRLGEQKSTAAAMVKMLNDLDKPEYKDLIKLFADLSNSYQQIQIKYTFAQPTNDEANHLTIVNGHTDVKPTDDQVKDLTDKINAIRNYITN